jgi:hypothetical protein
VETVTDVNGVPYSKFSGTMLRDYSISASTADEYEGGTIYFKLYTAPRTCTLTRPFTITRSRTLWGCQFEIWPALTPAELATMQSYQGGVWGIYFQAKDDGDYTVFDSPQFLGFGTLEKAYEDAYIDVVYADDYNQTDVIPYKREVTFFDLYATMHNGRNLKSEPSLWAARVVAAFEGGSSLVRSNPLNISIWFGADVDMDPDTVVDINGSSEPYVGSKPLQPSGSFEYLGVTPGGLNHSLIFLETLRDGNVASNRSDDPGGNQLVTKERVAIHEVTHSGGLYAIGHDDDGTNLMNTEPDGFSLSDLFSPKIINELRAIKTW